MTFMQFNRKNGEKAYFVGRDEASIKAVISQFEFGEDGVEEEDLVFNSGKELSYRKLLEAELTLEDISRGIVAVNDFKCICYLIS